MILFKSAFVTGTLMDAKAFYNNLMSFDFIVSAITFKHCLKHPGSPNFSL